MQKALVIRNFTEKNESLYLVLTNILFVALGSMLGGILRYLSMLAFPNYLFIVNVLGSFLIGILFFKLNHNFPHYHLLINVGLLGALTTFSSFSLALLQDINQGLFLKALTYACLSVITGLLLCYAGYKLASNVLI